MTDLCSMHIQTPLGPMTAVSNGREITGLLFGARRLTGKPDHVLKKLSKELDEYFGGSRTEFTSKIAPEGTEFQKRIWKQAVRTRFGKTYSYLNLSTMAGSPKAARACGQALNKNPILILIPCHRIISSDGNLTGFAGGLSRKKRLLQLEALS